MKGEKMKRFLVALGGALTSALLVTVPVGPASSHGGGLDSQGGHNCRVGACAGEYHCHQARGPVCQKALGVTPAAPNSSSSSKRFATCSAARRAGATPIRYPSALYDANRHLDRDRDGVACE